MRNKIFTKIIITTLLVTFLTFNVGRVTRVSAVGTTIAAAAGTALCAVGIIYCSYMLLSGAVVQVPDTVENIENWLTDMGTKVVQYPVGREAYNEIYPQLIGIGDEPLTSALDRAWDWTSDKLKHWADSFSTADALADIAAYYTQVDADLYPTNGFNYTITADFPTDIYFHSGGRSYNGSVEGFIDTVGQFYIDTAHLVYYNYGNDRYLISHSDIDATVRNLRVYVDNEYKYRPQYLDGTTWRTYSRLSWRNGYVHVGNSYYDVSFFSNGDIWRWQDFKNSISTTSQDGLSFTYPFFADAVIHDAETDTDLPMVAVPTDLVSTKPQWPELPPDRDKYPVIPYLKLPFNPNWIDPITGVPGGGKWGFNLADFLDKLEDLANLLMEIGALGELINQFKLQSGDNYYITYNDGDVYNYEYYTIANYGDDIYNVSIDVSHADEELPVDLNTISLYTQNRYLTQIKESAIAGSSMLRDLAVFWYDVDPEVTYIVLGCCILILVGAFTGKLGHS